MTATHRIPIVLGIRNTIPHNLHHHRLKCFQTQMRQKFTVHSMKNDDKILDSTTKSTQLAFDKDFLEGNAYLLATAVLWGSYSPALKSIFNIPNGPTPLVVAAGRGIIQASLLIFAVGLSLNNNNNSNKSSSNIDDNGATNIPQRQFTLPSTLPTVILASIEIGTYNTLGTLLQTWGISASTATRSAFLIQATALWTPLLAAAFGTPPSPLIWLSCIVALISTVFVTLDQLEGSDFSSLDHITNSIDTLSSNSAVIAAGDIASSNIPFYDTFIHSFSLGDIATLSAAFCYSLSTVRLPIYSSRIPPLQLAAGKSLVLALVSSTVLFGQRALDIMQETVIPATTTAVAAAASTSVHSLFQSSNTSIDRGIGIADFWPEYDSQPLAWAIIIWSAVGPGACSAYLHVKGQSLVSPTDAQVVFSTVPLWSALLAAALLPGESVGVYTWIGGGGMLGSGLIAAYAAYSIGSRRSATDGMERDQISSDDVKE